MMKKEYLAKLKETLKDLDSIEMKKQVSFYRCKINALIRSGESEKAAVKKIAALEKKNRVFQPIKEKIVKQPKLKSTDIKTKKVTKSNNQTKKIEIEEKTDVKPYNVIVREMVNLIFLIVALVLLYFPFNMININLIKAIQYFVDDLKFIYLASTIIYSLYLIVCVVALSHYLTYITNNINFEKTNTLFRGVKKVTLKILVIPSVLFIVLTLQGLIMSIFFYLDGFKVKSIPILSLGLFLFSIILYLTLRNKNKNKEKSIYYSFLIYILPLLLVCLGSVGVYREMGKYEYISNIDSIYTMKLDEFKYQIPEDSKFKIAFNTNYNTQYNIKYNEKLKNSVVIEITYYKDYYTINQSHDKNIAYISLESNLRRKVSLFLNNVKENRIINSNEFERYEVKIYVSKENEKRLVIEN